MKKQFEWFVAENTKTGKVMFGIRCSHGFIKYTESREAAEACVKSWNKKKRKTK